MNGVAAWPYRSPPAVSIIMAQPPMSIRTLDGWHVIRDTEQIKKRWVKLSDWLVRVVSLRGFWGSLGHCLRTRKMRQIHNEELSTHWNELGRQLKNIKAQGDGKVSGKCRSMTQRRSCKLRLCALFNLLYVLLF